MDTITQSTALEEAAFMLNQKANCFDVGTPEHTAYSEGSSSILAMVDELEKRDPANKKPTE